MATAATRPRHGLSLRLLALVVGVLVLAEGLIFTAGLQRERARWMKERLAEAQIAALALGDTPAADVPAGTRAALLQLTGAEMIRVATAQGLRQVLVPPSPVVAMSVTDLDTESWTHGFAQALGALVRPQDRQLEILGTAQHGVRLDVLVSQAPLSRMLRRYAVRFSGFACFIILATGTPLFVALQAMLVRPMRRIAGNIRAFRIDPERVAPLDAEGISMIHDDEVTMVGRELSALQGELRAALWRNARLAALGTAVAKMSHDLRGILSASLLVADRLTMNKDEKVRDAGEVIVRSVHRATGLAQHTLDFARSGPPPLERSPTNLRALADEAIAAIAEPGRHCAVQNGIAADISVNVERDSMLRVLTNLLRNAAQAGAHHIVLTGTGQGATTVVTLADDGPGLPAAVQERLFQPFVSSYRTGGSGLGLAIARDLMRAHGGDLQLAGTGPTGTSFTLYLQQPKREDE